MHSDETLGQQQQQQLQRQSAHNFFFCARDCEPKLLLLLIFFRCCVLRPTLAYCDIQNTYCQSNVLSNRAKMSVILLSVWVWLAAVLWIGFSSRLLFFSLLLLLYLSPLPSSGVSMFSHIFNCIRYKSSHTKSSQAALSRANPKPIEFISFSCDFFLILPCLSFFFIPCQFVCLLITRG